MLTSQPICVNAYAVRARDRSATWVSCAASAEAIIVGPVCSLLALLSMLGMTSEIR